MKEKGWFYIYITMKRFLMKHFGKIPNAKITDEFMQLYNEIMTVTEKYRDADPECNAQIQNIMYYMFNIFHSLEVLKKKL